MDMAIASAFIGSSGSRVLIALLAAGAAGLLVVVVTVLVGRRQAQVERQLAGYDLPDPAVSEAAARSAQGMMAEPETAMVQQAVALTSRLAERTGLMVRTEMMLEQADLPLRAGEVLFYVPAFAIIAFLLFAVIAGPLVGLLGAVAVIVAPYVYLSQRQRQRHSRFNQQLPDTLTLLASSLRAGFSLMQGLEGVAQEIADPMRKELQRVFTEVRLGRPVEDALGDTATRMENSDLGWTVMAIKIQREVGGNLAVLLDTVADTMVKRERIRREIQTLTAEGRLSGVILSLLPPAVGLAIWALDPDYVRPLFHDAWGILGLIGAGVLSVVGWLWLRKIVDIEV